VRNIHAGILLLYKEALLRRSPAGSNDVLIKARIEPIEDPTSSIKFVGIGRKTVDSRRIRERFQSLRISADWQRFNKIADVRNDIEHYFVNVSHASLRGVVASAYVLLRNFTVNELGENPRDLLSSTTWNVMLDAAEVHAAEREDCDRLLNSISWDSETLEAGIRQLRCANCGSDLLSPEGGQSYGDTKLSCRACGTEAEPDEFIPAAIEEALGEETYEALKDGADSPVASCPNCGSATYVMCEERCALCGESAEHECLRCGSRILPEEMDSSPLCGYCAHMMSKDD